LYTVDATHGVDKGESAGTALVLAAFYRYSVMAPNAVDQDMREKAAIAFKGVMSKLDEDGWLIQVSWKLEFGVDR